MLPYYSLILPFSSVSISCSFLHLHILPFPPSSLPSLLILLSGLFLYSLIAHNHSQSVSVTNRPIRVGSRPYGRQAAPVMVSSICFLPSTHASASHLCDLKGNVQLPWVTRDTRSASSQGLTGAVDPGTEKWVNLWGV